MCGDGGGGGGWQENGGDQSVSFEGKTAEYDAMHTYTHTHTRTHTRRAEKNVRTYVCVFCNLCATTRPTELHRPTDRATDIHTHIRANTEGTKNTRAHMRRERLECAPTESVHARPLERERECTEKIEIFFTKGGT